MENTQQVVIGTRVYTDLYGRGRGIVYGIHGQPRPDTTEIRNGIFHFGGRAEYDIVFNRGGETRHLPESILRGIQWRILGEETLATDAEIQELRKQNTRIEQEKSDAREAARIAREQEIAALRVDPAYAHLEQGDDQYGGKLAAANIRRELKKAFPGVKFSVRKPYYGSVDITFPKTFEQTEELKTVYRKYQSAHFDGMQDLEELHAGPWHVVFGGSKYVFAQREF